MSDPAFMDFEDPAPQRPASHGPRGKGRKGKKKPEIPRLPSKEVALTGDEVKRGVSERSRAAANLKVDGYSYMEIAEMLNFKSPQEAQRAVVSVLAAIHGNQDYETIRLIVTAQAQQQLKRSIAMAGADFLVTESGKKLPNTDRLRWHQAAAVDLMNYAIITGAKAPTKVEITPGEAEMDRIVREIVARQGVEDVVDAEVIDLEYIPPPPDPEDDDAEPVG